MYGTLRYVTFFFAPPPPLAAANYLASRTQPPVHFAPNIVQG
jgi:hypothetical protein